MNNTVKMSEELNCIQVLIATVLIGQPLTCLSAVV